MPSRDNHVLMALKLVRRSRPAPNGKDAEFVFKQETPRQKVLAGDRAVTDKMVAFNKQTSSTDTRVRTVSDQYQKSGTDLNFIEIPPSGCFRRISSECSISR